MKESLAFFAVAPRGVQDLLAEELKNLGAAAVNPSRSGAFFEGDLETGYRACLWLRTANRVLLPLCRFQAETPEALYEGVRDISWPEHIRPNGTLAVDFTASGSRITHTRYGALKVKDAVVDQFRDRCGIRPSVDLLRPDVRINVHLFRDEATVSLDLSGESLHKRGYRQEGGRAPLKENLGAAILLRAGWPDIAEKGGGLMDPMTGSGTLPIEAAWMAGDTAPGLLRTYFGFLRWRQHRADIWKRLLEEARERKDTGLKRIPPIVAYDTDRKAVRNALTHVEKAGLLGIVHIERRNLTDLVPHPAMAGHPGLVVLNPPYGERLGKVSELRSLYTGLGARMKAHFSGWKLSLFTGNVDLAKGIGLRAHKKYIFYNGPIECRLLNFQVAAERLYPATGPLRKIRSIPSLTSLNGGAEMLANRMRKNLRRLGKRFAREGISCFRLYDRDLPEYAVAVDVYGQFVHVQEYEAPAVIDPQKAKVRLNQALAAIREVLCVPEEAIFLKVRRRQKGKTQYGKQGNQGIFHEVCERDFRFLVNFTDYIDTGLFLDQRVTRSLIRDLARGKRFLNLFCYTGTGTVAAAMGGAQSTVSVDASGGYLDWARGNLTLNRIDLNGHFFYQADVLTWLKENRGLCFDLIFLDPPTFSNSKALPGTIDVERDHVRLIHSAAELLEEDGIIFFSSNSRGFRLDREALNGFSLKDLSKTTLPPDFQRRRRMHHVWKITKQQLL